MGDMSNAMANVDVKPKHYGLSNRGKADYKAVNGRMGMLKKVFADLYDPKHNPNGIVLLGVADNSLCRKELVDFFTSPGRLTFEPNDLTYANNFFASKHLLQSICNLYNTVPDGLYSREAWTPPLTKVKPEHLLIGNGATEIIEAVFWDLCDEGDGVLLSEPYYNAFDEDLTFRAKVNIVPVHMPLPASANDAEVSEPTSSFAENTIEYYQRAYDEATSKGVRVRALLVCNPHNPTGGVYPRATIVALAAFAAKYDLHLVVDEIYARSLYPSRDVPEPTQFDSILRIDTLKEAELHPSRVHVISSASKDFSINGFRIGIFISQHNPDLIDAMFANARFAQTPSPSGQLFAALLDDAKYLDWFLRENRKRLTASYNWTTEYLNHHKIPYVPSSAGHFLLVDFRQFMDKEDVDDDGQSTNPSGVASATNEVEAAAKVAWGAMMTPERKLTYKLIQNRVLISPGAQYHHPTPGFFRLTFSIDPPTMQLGLAHLEKALGLTSWIEQQPLVQF